MENILKFGGLAVVAYFAYQYWQKSTCADRAKAPFLLKIKQEAIDNYNALHADVNLPNAQPTQEAILKFLDGAYKAGNLTYDPSKTPGQKIAMIRAKEAYTEPTGGSSGNYRSTGGTDTTDMSKPAQVFVRAYVDYYTWQVNSGQYDDTDWFCKEYAK